MDTKENDDVFLNELKKLTKKTIQEDSFDKLKDLTKKKIINENGIEIKENISKKNYLNKNEVEKIEEKKEDEKELETKAKKSFFEKKEEKKFSWEKNNQLPAKTEPFEEYKMVDEKIFKNFNNIKEKFENEKKDLEKFDWEKRKKIEEPLPEDFEIKKTNYDWLKNQIGPNFEKNENEQKKEFLWEKYDKIEEPKIENFIIRENENNYFEQENQKPIEFNWLKRKKIEEPKIEDFNIREDIEKKDFEEKIVGPKWKQKVVEEKTTKNLKKEDDSEIKKEEVKKIKWGQKKQNIEKGTWKTSKKSVEKKDLEKLKTPIDEMFEILEQYKITFLENIAKATKMEYYSLEQIAKMFEDYGIVDLKYSTSLKAKAKISLKKEVVSKIKEIPSGEIMSEYEIEVDNVPAKIKIIMLKEEARPLYAIEMPSIGKYTKKFLDFIKTEIAESMPIELDEILDPKKAKVLKKRFFEESQKQLKKYFSTSTKETLDILSGTILHEMYGLGEIEVILGDDMLEEVAINSSKTPIAIYHRIHGWMKTNLLPGTEEEIMNYASQIGRKVGREITVLNPILDAHLLSGDRVNATLFPISAEGNTLTIRRFARKPWTLIDFIGKAHTMSSEMAALLWLAMQYEMNIMISGGTASGKTSTLNTLLALVPSYHRIVSIEDVREIILPIYLTWNWIPMITRSANPEGLGEVTMLECMISSLRMRPDRIIVGEVRRKREAEVMMEAIETGHSIYSTIHANSAYQVLRRMAEPPMSIPVMQIELIDLIVVQFRDRKTNKRRTYEISEIEQTSTGKGLQINTIYKWVPRNDSWEQLNKPTKLLTTLNQHTGLTEDEINKELLERKKILDWMQNQNITELNQIGYIVKLFYSNPEKVKKMAMEKISKEQIDGLIK
ncbi:MAG: ATPase, T2SS/T4P/T4SS family [Candidatus ainarchaeum sp.]|nr:ATPase, T2SS/T4P/T4SS family [Candidatus ainarchaeum sp.]